MTQERTQDGRTSNRGFASMKQERQRQIASMGGRAVPDEKRSFSQNRRLAAEAGRKGGQSVPGAKRSFSQNRELAAQAGRKGGQSVPDEKRSFSQNPGNPQRLCASSSCKDCTSLAEIAAFKAETLCLSASVSIALTTSVHSPCA